MKTLAACFCFGSIGLSFAGEFLLAGATMTSSIALFLLAETFDAP